MHENHLLERGINAKLNAFIKKFALVTHSDLFQMINSLLSRPGRPKNRKTKQPVANNLELKGEEKMFTRAKKDLFFLAVVLERLKRNKEGHESGAD